MIREMTRLRLSGPVLVLAALLLIVPACGPGEFHHDVYPAGGVVTYRGEPVAGATVTFHPVDPATIAVPEGEEGPRIGNPTTRTDAEGRFSLSTYYADDGAPAGDYTVTVIWAPDVLAVDAHAGEEVEDESDPRTARARRHTVDRLQGRYADPASSPLKAVITPDGENQFAYDLD